MSFPEIPAEDLAVLVQRVRDGENDLVVARSWRNDGHPGPLGPMLRQLREAVAAEPAPEP